MALTVLLLWERWSPFLLRLLPESLWVTARAFLRSPSSMGSKGWAAVRVVSRVLLVALVLIVPASSSLSLAVAEVPPLTWCDLGTPERVARSRRT